jgi:uncharacterized protein YjbJ (UPF0337 family)
MDWAHIQENWKHLTEKIKLQWERLSDDDIEGIEGSRDQLSGKVQEIYGIDKDTAEQEVDRWGSKIRDDDLPKYQ